MTVQEALEILHGDTREDALYQYDREDRPYILARAERMAIKALEEVEQYRALGTVEEIKKKIKTELPYMSLAQARFKSELDEYRNLGTVEELKEAREKQRAVKHHHTRVDNIIDKVRKSVCPKCLGLIYTHQEEYPNYCINCGQRIDWSEEDD